MWTVWNGYFKKCREKNGDSNPPAKFVPIAEFESHFFPPSRVKQNSTPQKTE